MMLKRRVENLEVERLPSRQTLIVEKFMGESNDDAIQTGLQQLGKVGLECDAILIIDQCDRAPPAQRHATLGDFALGAGRDR